MDKNFEKTLDKERKKIEIKISDLLVNKEPKLLYEPCAYIMQSGGKRLRPMLVLMSAKAAGGAYKQAYNAAAAIEILHNFTLVHDDIMDNADKRRGLETLHKKYDVNTAILAGDNLIAVAYISLLKDCKDRHQEIINYFTKGVVEVCEGQSLDKDFESRESVSLDEYKMMIGKKTGALLEVCCAIGALLGGGDKKTVKALADFGYNIGLAFQIQDDLLDMIADEKQFGKSIGGDLVEGKKTFLLLTALERATGEDKNKLIALIKSKGIKKSEIKSYKKIYEKLGVFSEAEKEIKFYTGKAMKQIQKINSYEDQEIFKWFANSLIQRKK
jgi:geranylgeranyl diphosphate synthase type II